MLGEAGGGLGFYLINARDLNDATQMASKIPSARLGSVEVRPIVEVRPVRKDFKPQ